MARGRGSQARNIRMGDAFACAHEKEIAMPKELPSIKDEDTYEALRDKGFGKTKAARIANAQANDAMHPSRKGGKAPPYEDWTKDELVGRARDLEVKGRSGMTKDELIDALRAQ